MSKHNERNDSGIPWHAWGCMAIAFLIPTFKKYVPGFIGLLAIYCIVFAIRRKRIYFKYTHFSMLLMACLFILLVIGIASSGHLDVARMEVEIKLSFIAFPIIAWLLPVLSRKNFDKIAKTFVNGCLLFAFSALIYGCYRSIHANDFAYLSYEELSINYHPTYAATYQCLSLFILLVMAEKKHWILGQKILHITFIIVTSFFISLLASKAGIITGLCVVILAMIYGYSNAFGRVRSFSLGIVSALVLVGGTYMFPASSARVEAMVEDIESDSPEGTSAQEAKSSTELRKVTWSAALQVIREHPLGAGTGETQYRLNEIYEQTGQGYAARRNLNAHNQFLQTGAEHGWAGMILLTALMIFQVIGMARMRNNIMLCVIGICLLNFLFESYLEVQAGIVFYCFWSMIYARSQRPELISHATQI